MVRYTFEFYQNYIPYHYTANYAIYSSILPRRFTERKRSFESRHFDISIIYSVKILTLTFV